MILDQEKTIGRISGNGQSAEANSRQPGLHDAAPIRSGHRKLILFTAMWVVAALVGWAVKRHSTSNTTPAIGVATARGQSLPVPVVDGVVGTSDVPIYLDGLGTVQAFNTVAVHTRVDGQLIKVAFNEGQDVGIGDVLAQIDPAPYQAALDQAVAKKAQDQAQLTNARVDLQRYADLLKTDSITQQIYDTEKALVSQLEATVNADQAAAESANAAPPKIRRAGENPRNVFGPRLRNRSVFNRSWAEGLDARSAP